MVLLLLREPLSYFRPYKNYFVAIYAFFNAFPISQLVVASYPEDSLLRLTSLFFASAAAIIAALWGFLVTKLYFYPEKFSLREVLAKPVRPIHLVYILYLIPMVLLVVIASAIPSSIYTGPGVLAFYVFDGQYFGTFGLSPLILFTAATVITVFTLYPFLVLSRLRSELKDREVRDALRVISSCFAVIAILLLFGYALSSFGYSVLGSVNLACVILLIAAVRAFKQPTFLKAFLGIVPSLESSPTAMRDDQMVLIYPNNEAKLRPLSRLVSEGVSQGFRVLLFHFGDETIVRQELSRSGIDVKYHIMKGNLRLGSIDSLYQGEGLFDEEAAIGQCQELASETRALGKKGLKIVIDYGDSIKRPFQKFIKHLSDARWTSSDHYEQVLMTFTNRAFEGQLEALKLLKTKIPVLDLNESTDFFTRTVGLSHNELAGKKILLEYDPLSDYERVLRSLITEAVSNFERVVLFTRKDSPVHSTMVDEPGLKMFVLTSKVSYPKQESENRYLLPAFDSSLILDSLNKTIEAYAASSLTVVFDSISHQIFTVGTERAHSFVRQALELMVSNNITAIFLMNSGAHDSQTISYFEGLFDVELVCKPGARVPDVRKKASLTA